MSSTYNAITNLQEIEMDSLIVNLATIDTALVDNLDCNVGVIDTLTSTTASLTSANIPTLTNTTAGITTANITTANITTENTTTSNTTNLNTNNIQPNPVSSAVSLYTTGTGVLTLGNTSNTNALTINQNITLPANKIITLDATGGKIVCNEYQGTSASSAILLFSNTTGNSITIGNTSNGNGIVIRQQLIMSANKDILISGSGALRSNKIEAQTETNVVNLFNNQTNFISFGNNLGTGGGIIFNDNITIASNRVIYLSSTGGKVYCNIYTGTSTSSNLTIGETGDTGTLTIYKTIASPTMSGTLSVNDIQGTTTSSAITLFTLSSVSSPTITLGNLTGGVFTINPNTSMNGNLTLASSKTITLNATGGKVLSNVYTGTTTSSNLTIGETGDTGTLTIFKTIAGTFSVDSISATTTTSTGNLFNNIAGGTINIGTGLTGNMNIATSLANNILTIGNAFFIAGISTGSVVFNLPLTCNQNITLASSRKVLSNIYTGTTTSSNLTIGESGDTGTLTIYKTIAGTLSVNDIQGTSTSSSITLFTNSSVSSPTITLGNLTGGVFTINPNTQLNGTLTLASNKNLTLSSTGNLICNTLQGTSTSSTISLYSNITAGIINIGTGLASSSSLNIATLLLNGIITIGNPSFNPATNTGYVVCHNPLYLNQDFNLATDKNVITSSTSKVYCNVYTGISTSSNLTIGESGDTGTLTIYKATTFSGGNSTFGTIITNTISATASNSTATLFGNITNGSVSIAGALTDGNLLVGFGMRNYGIRLGSPFYNSATDTGYIDLLLPVNVQYNITMSTTNKILCNSYQGRTSNSNVSLFTETTGAVNTITIGSTSASSTTINTPVILATGKTLTTSTTGSILCPTYNSTSATQALTIGSTNTTTNVSIATGLTTGNLVLGSNNVSSKNYSASDLYIQTSAGSDRTLYGTTIRATTFLGTVQASSLYSTTLTQDISIGAGLTTGNINLSNLSATTGLVAIQSRFRQTRTISAINLSSYWNVALGSANNIFQSAFLSTFAFPPIFTSADTFTWSVWESNTGGEGSFIAQNGETSVICNPGDQSAFHWQDEDNMAIASGFKFSTAGVMSTSSDRRLKRDINPIPVGSDLLDKLSLIEYVNYKKKAPTEEKYYKNGKLRQKYQDIHKGLIAQDVKQIFPEVVEKDGEYLMMKYAEVDIYFNMGVQELIKRNKAQQIEIDNNKTLINTQQTIIDDLTARLVRLEQLILNP